MEKIYMEEYQQENNYNNNSRNILSLVLCVFSVMILAFFGITGVQSSIVSHAVPIEVPSQITIHKTSDFYVEVYNSSDSSKKISVPIYFSDTEKRNPVFSIEKNNTNHPADNSIYTKNSTVDDLGLQYIINNSYLAGGKFLNGESDYYEMFLTQVAIWVYLDLVYPDNNNYKVDENWKSILENCNTYTYTGNSTPYTDNVTGEGNTYLRKVKTLINEAIGIRNEKSLAVLKNSVDLVKSNDGKYYRTSVITVVGNAALNLKNYSIKVSGVNDVDVINENGEKLNSDNVDAGVKFYILIPSSEISNEVKNLKVEVTGHFKELLLNEYTSSNLQKLIYPTDNNRDITSELNIEVVGTPNTKLNSTKTFYFIGVIVLICGMGMVLVNSKSGIRE